MKQIYVLLVMASLLFVGCSSSYRTMQTPDDIQFGISADNEEYVNLSTEAMETGITTGTGLSEDLAVPSNPIYSHHFVRAFNIGSPYYGFGSPFYSPLPPFYSLQLFLLPLYGAYLILSPFSMGYTGFWGEFIWLQSLWDSGYYGYNPVVAGYYTGHSYYPL